MKINTSHTSQQTYSISDIRTDSDTFAAAFMIRFLTRLLPLAFCLSAVSIHAQQFLPIKDLKPEWMTYSDSGFVTGFGENRAAIYLKLQPPDTLGLFLAIENATRVSLFVNQKLAGEFTKAKLNLDSLCRVFSSRTLLLGIYSDRANFGMLKTTLLKRTTPGEQIMVARSPTFFKDFVIIGPLLLLTMVVAMVRFNPKLAADYFSLSKVFSLREMEDAQLSTRIASSTNILFYVFCSLLAGYYLIIVFHFTTGVYPLPGSFAADSFAGTAAQWLKLSGYLLVFLFVKIILVLMISFLFGITEVAGVHFFNWVRLMVLFFGLLSVVLFLYFIWHGQSVVVHTVMFKLLAWIIGLWMVVIFLKLSNKANASMFHLFSYICATEIIPFLLIVKVLYY